LIWDTRDLKQGTVFARYGDQAASPAPSPGPDHRGFVSGHRFSGAVV